MSRWPFRPDGLKSVRIDIDPVGNAAVHARCRCRRGRAGRHRRIARRGPEDGLRQDRGRRAAIREASAAALEEIQQVQPQMAYLNILREVLPPNAIVTDELSQVGFASWYGFPIYEPRTFISSGYQGTLGSGFPTALGAKVANPEHAGGRDHRRWRLHVRRAGTGDRGAVQHRRGDAGVQQQRLWQCAARPDASASTAAWWPSDLVNPDFVKLAESFGVGAARVTSPDQFRPALEKALARWRALSDRHRGADGIPKSARGRSFIRRRPLALRRHSAGDAKQRTRNPFRHASVVMAFRARAARRPGMTKVSALCETSG